MRIKLAHPALILANLVLQSTNSLHPRLKISLQSQQKPVIHHLVLLLFSIANRGTVAQNLQMLCNFFINLTQSTLEIIIHFLQAQLKIHIVLIINELSQNRLALLSISIEEFCKFALRQNHNLAKLLCRQAQHGNNRIRYLVLKGARKGARSSLFRIAGQHHTFTGKLHFVGKALGFTIFAPFDVPFYLVGLAVMLKLQLHQHGSTINNLTSFVLLLSKIAMVVLHLAGTAVLATAPAI